MTAPHSREFEGRAVLVTGASRGIGRAIAEGFAARGARVALHYRASRAAAEAVLAALPGGPHMLAQAELADPAAAGPLIESVARELGGLHVLVNNAGIFEEHRVLEMGFDAWCDAFHRTVGANLLGPAYLTYWAARHMVAKGGGRIVNISSRGAFRGEPDAPAYGASKAGLNALGQSMARALAPHNVYVYVVAPGWVDTDMAGDHLSGPEGDAIRAQSPLNRVARPEEIAHTVLFLASEGAELLTGGIIDVNGASYLRS